jgi:predicted amidohydrolase
MERSLFAVCGVQHYVSAVAENVSAIESRVNVIMGIYPWVQMVLLSELAPLGPLTVNAQPLPNQTEARFQALARKHRIWLLPGSMFERDGAAIYNTATVIDPDGAIVARYRKMFPFLPYEEGVEGGDQFCVFDVPEVGRFGVSICYDMWFPETTRTLAAMGAEVILHPTLTSSIDRDVELAMARASAAQNQCFFFDVNGMGDGGIGRSVIVGPHGDVLYTGESTEQMIPVEIDIGRVRRSREIGVRGLGQTLKSFRDRKVHFSVYERDAPNHFAMLGALKKPERGSSVGLSHHAAPGADKEGNKP